MKRRVSEFKRWLSTIVIIAMLFTCFPLSSWAESEAMVEANNNTDVNSENEDNSDNVPEKGTTADNTVALENTEASNESVSVENDDANNESTPTESAEAYGESAPVESANASNESAPADITGIGIESVPEEDVGASNDNAAESVDVSNENTPEENIGTDTDTASIDTADAGSESTSKRTAGVDVENDPVESADINNEVTPEEIIGEDIESDLQDCVETDAEKVDVINSEDEIECIEDTTIIESKAVHEKPMQPLLAPASQNISIDGSFSKSSYTMTAGDSLRIKVNASATNANLTRVTVNVDGSGNDRLSSKEISGTSWNGNLTLDGTVAPLNTPGTYTLKLYVAVDSGDPNYAQVDTATLVVEEAQEEVIIDGSFAKSSYTMTAGDSLRIKVSASATNANLTRVTVNVDASGNDRLASKEISGTSWNGNLTLDGTVAPLNTPGTYTLKLYVAVDSGDPNYAQVDTATLVVEEAATSIDGVFGKDSYTMKAGGSLDVDVSASATNANLTRVTVNVDASGNDRLASKEISGTSWNGNLTLDGTVAPLNTPGTYTLKLYVAVDSGDPNYAQVDTATLVVEEATETTIGKPDVTVTVNGATMTATWGAVEGTAKYVYSLRNTTDDQLIANHVEATSPLSLTLDAGKSYRLAVGAVPAGVDDVANPEKCGWDEDEFSIATETTIGKPDVTVTVNNGTTMTATWGAVEGAAKYVYSLRNTTDDQLIANHVEATSPLSLTLDAGKSYRLAVGAVPAGVDDTANPEKCGWDEDEFTLAAETTIGKPDVTVTVNGTTMTATWGAVEGAAKYVYSLRNTTDDQLIANHVEATSPLSLTLDAGKSYRLAVGAVPAGVDDVADPEKCGWDEDEFTLATETTIDKPDVTVTMDGTTMTATWAAVEGAAKYVYSLRNTTDDQLIANHVEATSPLSLTLDTGKSYRLAVGAVPAGVDDVANPDKCGWDQDEFSIATETTIGKPDVTVTVNGATMTATWAAVEGASKYVYSLRNTTDDQLIANHVEATSPLSLTLDAGKTYRLAVGAVPAGVDDVANPDKCGWDEDEFSIANAIPTITIISPEDTSEVSFGKDLVVEWTTVDQADHYEFSARYDDEIEPIISRDIVYEGTYQIDAGQLKLGKRLNLWVGACDVNGQLIDETVQAAVTVTIAAMGKPDVTIDIDELNLLATWPVVEGAARYVYSLKNVTDNVPLADHEDANSRTITQTLQVGKEYRLAVGAVPAGVDDLTSAASCSWTEKSFDTMPTVVDFTVEPNPVMLGKEATFKVYNQRTEKIKLIVDDVEYEDYEVGSDPQIVKRAFSQAGKRNVQFKAFGGGVWGDPCDAVQIEVLPAGKVPDPVISNITEKEILLSDNRTVYWRVEGEEEDLGIDYYTVTLARNENGAWAPVYVVNTTDDHEASGGGISLRGLLDVPGNYRLMVIAVPYGEGIDSELTGRASVEFGYKTVPEFSLTEIMNDETIGTPVTVKWNRPIWDNNKKLRPDKYIVWWYGPDMENGMAVEMPGSSTEAVLASDYCKQPGDYAVGVYAILGEQQSYASGNNEFEKATPEVSIETKKGPYLTTEQFYAIGSTKGGIKYVRVQLEKDGGAELVSLVGADGNPCDYIVVGVDPETKKYMALLRPVNELVENGTYALAVYGFFSDADAYNANLRADSKYIMLTINGSKVDRVDLIGSRTSEKVSATWRYTNDSIQVRVHGNDALKNMVVSWAGGSADQQKAEKDGDWNKWLYSNPFSFSSSGKRSLTVDVDGKKRYVTVYIVKPQSGTRYAAKDSVAVLWLPGGNTRKTIGLNDVATIKGEYGDYWLVNAGGVEGFILKDLVSNIKTEVLVQIKEEVKNEEAVDAKDCKHTRLVYTYSSVHPHSAIMGIKCSVCGKQVYPRPEGEEFDGDYNLYSIVNSAINSHEAHVVVGCTKCFPGDRGILASDNKATTKDRITNTIKRDIVDGAQEYWDLSELAYSTDVNPGKDRIPKNVNKENQYRLDINSGGFNTDCLIQVDPDENEGIVLTIAFEGSAGGIGNGLVKYMREYINSAFSYSTDADLLITKWLNNGYDTSAWTEEEQKALEALLKDDKVLNEIDSQDDWWETDFNAPANEWGIHSGVYNAIKRFQKKMGKNSKVLPMPYDYPWLNASNSDNREGITYTSLEDILDYARNDPDKVKIRVTGHSLGGAEAQVYTYILLKEYNIRKDQICTYTFASFVPFLNEAIEDSVFDDVNVYNFINVRDFVPKFGVTLVSDPGGAFVGTVGNELYSTTYMMLYQMGLQRYCPGGFVAGGINLGYNIYMEGDRQKGGLLDTEGFGKEHTEYGDLLSAKNTEYRIVNTRPYMDLTAKVADYIDNPNVILNIGDIYGAGDRLIN